MIEALLARRGLKAVFLVAPWLIALALAMGLSATRFTLKRVRLEHRAELAAQQREAARAEAANAERVAAAADAHAARAAALHPVVVRSTDIVRTYAETPAGRGACLGPDRVRGLDELDAALRAAEPAGGGADPVPPDAGAPPAGR